MTIPEHTTAPHTTIPRTGGSPTGGSAEALAALEEAYAQIKRVSRELRPSDRIAAGLAIDSLAIVEILLVLEERFGIERMDDPRTAKVTSVGDLVELITVLRAEATS